MIKIKTDGPVGDQYKDWCAAAVKARKKILDDWQASKDAKAQKDAPANPAAEPNQVAGASKNAKGDQKTSEAKFPSLNQQVWSDLKKIFLNDIFHEKCAYCEGKVAANFPLDVEHYRPKKEVTENRLSTGHQGYFWLAYEWYNLILACRNCNSNHSSRCDGEYVPNPGKLNEFPVSGKRVTEPSGNPEQWQAELEGEEPLLLNPYSDNPAEHIAFDDKGVPYPYNQSERGRQTIKICHLDRFELIEARRDKAKESVRIRIIDRLADLAKGLKSVDDPYFECSESFSAWLNHSADLMTQGLRKPFGNDSD
jgi:hypothetical protein